MFRLVSRQVFSQTRSGYVRSQTCIPTVCRVTRNVTPNINKAFFSVSECSKSKETSSTLRNADRHYRKAVVCGIADSLATVPMRDDASSNVNFDKAREQHTAYVKTLESLGLDVIRLEADEMYPDCVFVVDCAVVVANTALITRPGLSSRRGEVDRLRIVLGDKLNMNIVEIEDPKALVDGGDVLFTGQEMLVGVSKRTNEEGVRAIASAFPQFPVTRIEVDTLHLCSVTTVAGDGLIAIGNSPAAQSIRRQIEQSAKCQYKFLQMLDDIAANVMFVNGHLLIRTREEIGSNNYEIFANHIQHPLLEVRNDELYKVNGCLTSNAVLIP